MMVESLSQLHLLRPWWLLALIPLAGLAWALWRRQSTRGDWQTSIDAVLLPHLLEQTATKHQRWPLLALIMAWLLTCVALSGPSWQKLPQPVQQKQDALIILFDLSLSMLAEDEKPSRLVVAQRKLSDVLNQRREGLSALIVYSGDAHVVAPLTEDAQTLASLLPALSPAIMPSFGSNVSAAAKAAFNLMAAAGIHKARWLLVTDEIRPQDADTLGALLKEQDVRLSILGIGSEAGAPIPGFDNGFLKTEDGNIVIAKLNTNTLQNLAAASKGRYMHVQLSDDDIRFLLPPSRLPGAESYKITDREFDTWEDAGYWLTLLLLPAVALGFRRGWLGLFVGAFLLQPQQGWSLDWQDLWQTRDQQAYEKFQQGDYPGATELFDDPEWKGAAQFKAGDYEAAASSFAGSDTPAADYNRGQALTNLQRYDEAIKAYETALKKAPDMLEAQRGKALAEALKQQQEQNKQQQQSEAGDQKHSPQQDQSQSPQQQESQAQPGQNGEQQDAAGQSPGENGEQNATPSHPDAAKADPSGNPKGQETPPASEGKDNQAQERSSEGKTSDNVTAENQAEATSNDPAAPSEDATETTTEVPALPRTSQEAQAEQQWLRKIPDDPAGLLRNKFRYQFQQNRQNGELVPDEKQAW